MITSHTELRARQNYDYNSRSYGDFLAGSGWWGSVRPV